MTYHLSIIIPSWNSSKYLNQCLESSLNQQTSHKYQVVLVDDGSQDNSKAIYKKYQKPNFNYYLRPHLGQAATKNYAIKKAKANLILLLDSDDFLTPNAVEVVIKYFHDHPNINYAYSEHFGVDSNSNIIYKTYKKDFLAKNAFKYQEDLILHCCFHGHLMAMRKSVFSDVGGFNQKLPVGVDYDWILRFTEKYQAGYIPKYLYYYREHQNGINKLIDKNPSNIEKIIQQALSRRHIHKKVVYSGRNEVGYRTYQFLEKLS